MAAGGRLAGGGQGAAPHSWRGRGARARRPVAPALSPMSLGGPFGLRSTLAGSCFPAPLLPVFLRGPDRAGHPLPSATLGEAGDRWGEAAHSVACHSGRIPSGAGDLTQTLPSLISNCTRKPFHTLVLRLFSIQPPRSHSSSDTDTQCPRFSNGTSRQPHPGTNRPTRASLHPAVTAEVGGVNRRATSHPQEPQESRGRGGPQ